MSAFVVGHDHIDALLTFADMKRLKDRLGYHVNKGREQLSLTDIGRILLAENERSVCTRYPDCTPGNTPGKVGEEAIGYRFKTLQQAFQMQHTALCVMIIKACDCYDYQACETDDYRQSIAAHIVNTIRREAIRVMPGYDDAPWEIDRARLSEKIK